MTKPDFIDNIPGPALVGMARRARLWLHAHPEHHTHGTATIDAADVPVVLAWAHDAHPEGMPGLLAEIRAESRVADRVRARAEGIVPPSRTPIADAAARFLAARDTEAGLDVEDDAEHVVLVAFTVKAPDRKVAQARLFGHLPRPGTGALVEWWVAEDDRIDGSDNASAVFVPGALTDPGVMSQDDAAAFLTARDRRRDVSRSAPPRRWWHRSRKG